jgi:putative lipoprotein
MAATSVAVVIVAAAMSLSACRTDERALADHEPGGSAVEVGSSRHGANETAVLEGSIAYRQRVALPKDATVMVRLIDLSRGAAAGVVVAERSFPAQGQVPIRFRLPYDPSRVSSQNAYGIEARILVDGALWFVSDQPVAVLTRGAPADAQVMLRMAPSPG